MQQLVSTPKPPPGSVDVWDFYEEGGEVLCMSVRSFLYFLSSPSTRRVHVRPGSTQQNSGKGVVELLGPERGGAPLEIIYEMQCAAIHDEEFGLSPQEKVLLRDVLQSFYMTRSAYDRGVLRSFLNAMKLAAL